MNLVVLKGNVSWGPISKKVSTAKGDKTVVNFNLAVNRRYKKADGSNDEEVSFIPCEAWDTGAELIDRILNTGDGVTIEGSLKEDKWEKDGKSFSRLKVRVTRFYKDYGKSKGDASSSYSSDDDNIPLDNDKVDYADEGDDEIPF